MAYLFLNNNIIDVEHANISVQDRGFLYGDSLFETLRSYNGNIFNFEKHFSRLKGSSNILKIPLNYTCDKVREIINELLKKNNLLDAYIRITLSRGVGSEDLGFRISYNSSSRFPVFEPTFVVQVKPISVYSVELYKKGMSIIISKFRISTSCPIASHKTSNFLTNILAMDEASSTGAHEAILLNTDGSVAEGACSSLFIVKDDTVITPGLNANILPGITRNTVLDICRNNGIPVKEESFGVDLLLKADECFLTNSLMEIMAVSEINGTKIENTIPGEKTKYLMLEYKKLSNNLAL